ncbi:hypothetical protein LIPSTDRAFT_205308 [Lipomyces starkeyi NRRL Y-11557]|uniref:Uncharacterized protein n=1 Tax=Lipomyces starkeyi NRRL Y-11557 TaxID=675824 RepID=A0A1E3QCK6_LIPST|nr:hypothetical protein LIPSTDRAFT_205308 [Lipomyces starkeyi NRRL Y-11557]
MSAPIMDEGVPKSKKALRARAINKEAVELLKNPWLDLCLGFMPFPFLFACTVLKRVSKNAIYWFSCPALNVYVIKMWGCDAHSWQAEYLLCVEAE